MSPMAEALLAAVYIQALVIARGYPGPLR
jgi:hypothetical protein